MIDRVFWRGSEDEFSGYGNSNIETIRALREGGCTVVGEPTDGVDVGIAYAPASVAALEQLPTPYRILYTMFEGSLWPADWVDSCNCANRVWVPSPFVKETLTASGCVAPIDVIPQGVNPKVYNTRGRTCDRPNDTFVIGYCGVANHRKGYDLAVRAFLEEFDPSENCKMSIRSSSILRTDIPKDLRIAVSRGDLSTEEMKSYYQSVDLLVLPSRGEGFGLSPIEAMACGTCVAVTNWGGSTCYLSDDTLRIAVDGLESCKAYWGSPGQWARPSLSSLRYCMRWAFEHRAEAARMGLVSAKRVAKDWTYSKAADAINAVLAKIDPSERVDIEKREMVVWTGNPRSIVTRAGGFIRGAARELTPTQMSRINFDDERFQKTTRYRRKVAS